MKDLGYSMLTWPCHFLRVVGGRSQAAMLMCSSRFFKDKWPYPCRPALLPGHPPLTPGQVSTLHFCLELRSPDCTSLNLDRRAEQCTPLTEVQDQWAPRSGPLEPGLPDRKSGWGAIISSHGGSFPAETCRLPPGSHPLLHLLCRATAECMSCSVLPKKSQKSFP